MRVMEWEGNQFHITVKDVARPKIQHPLDAVVRLTTAGICGTDIHIYRGRLTDKPPITLGHEMIDVIDQVGAGVTTLRAGDRVIVYDDTSCGFCDNCIRGLRAYCLTVNPPFEGAYFSIASEGVKLNGGQSKPICLCSMTSLTYDSPQRHNMFAYPMLPRQRYCCHLGLTTSSITFCYATFGPQLELASTLPGFSPEILWLCLELV
jgi:Zn-dependent alcohol dehydrogenase